MMDTPTDTPKTNPVEPSEESALLARKTEKVQPLPILSTKEAEKEESSSTLGKRASPLSEQDGLVEDQRPPNQENPETSTPSEGSDPPSRAARPERRRDIKAREKEKGEKKLSELHKKMH